MTTPDLSDVSIVMLSHNRRDSLVRVMPGLVSLVERCGCELVVVDNASTDGSAALIAEALRGRDAATLIANERNLGVAGGRNAGWRMATRAFILNIDDDITVSAEAVDVMANILRGHPGVGVAGPVIADFDTGSIQYSFGEAPTEIGNFQGACHLIRRALAESVGYNDEACSFGGEEIDLSLRIRAAGYSVMFIPDAAVLHRHTIRQGRTSRDRRRRWLSNYMRILHTHFPPRDAWAFSSRYFLSHAISGLRACGAIFALGLIVPAARGIRDGRRQYRPVPEEVVRFYRNPALRPELGNVPLRHKMRRALSRWPALSPDGA